MSVRTLLIAKSIKDLKEDVLVAETKMLRYSKMADDANYKLYLLNKKLEEGDIERTDQQERIGILQKDLQTALDGLREISRYGYGNDGICPYGCDTPDIANKTLNKIKTQRI